jgi:hypothetical protein
MIAIMEESADDLVAARASGKISADDYTEAWLPALQKAIDAHGKIRALLYMDETFDGWELGAMWEDAKFGLSRMDDFEKVALVGAPEWVDKIVDLTGPLTSISFKSFPTGSLDEALGWLR